MLVFTQDFFAPTFCCLLLLLEASAFSHHSPPSSDPCDFTVNDIRHFASSSSFKPLPFDPSSVTALHSAWSSSRDHIATGTVRRDRVSKSLPVPGTIISNCAATISAPGIVCPQPRSRWGAALCGADFDVVHLTRSSDMRVLYYTYHCVRTRLNSRHWTERGGQFNFCLDSYQRACAPWRFVPAGSQSVIGRFCFRSQCTSWSSFFLLIACSTRAHAKDQDLGLWHIAVYEWSGM